MVQILPAYGPDDLIPNRIDGPTTSAQLALLETQVVSPSKKSNIPS